MKISPATCSPALAAANAAVELAWAEVVSSSNRRGTPWGDPSAENMTYARLVAVLLSLVAAEPVDLGRALFG
jgi:hypothetical protein